jgi:hypothetical protein
LHRGSSDHHSASLKRTVSNEKRRDDHNVEAVFPEEDHRCPSSLKRTVSDAKRANGDHQCSANSKRTVLSVNRTNEDWSQPGGYSSGKFDAVTSDEKRMSCCVVVHPFVGFSDRFFQDSTSVPNQTIKFTSHISCNQNLLESADLTSTIIKTLTKKPDRIESVSSKLKPTSNSLRIELEKF